jgi:hypothetical protein
MSAHQQVHPNSTPEQTWFRIRRKSRNVGFVLKVVPLNHLRGEEASEQREVEVVLRVESPLSSIETLSHETKLEVISSVGSMGTSVPGGQLQEGSVPLEEEVKNNCQSQCCKTREETGFEASTRGRCWY